ncbi:MAG: SDR family NAD(P)-dependent oxidoreductase, partial [Pseudorhodobacter sp.]|nr:SDR family NAD(P)-dependent oxidoreductase [Pseudorhodobacter sp.]
MGLGITGKSALVFDAGGRLGGAIAQALAAEGARVLVTDIDAAAITGAGGQAVALQWNIGDLSVLVARLDFVTQTFGGMDILANNTGGSPLTPVQGTWSRHFDSMVRSVISVTNAVLPGMKARGWGRIITTTSSGVVAPIAN